MSSKKTFLIMLITLILITMGGAWASDDHAVDEVSATDDDAIAVDSVDDTQKDTSTIQENLTSQKNDEAVKAADSQSNQKGEILSASNDEDVLGAPWTTDKTVSSETTISSTQTIDGGGHSIKYQTGKSGRFYTVGDNVKDVVFRNITFIGGSINAAGGAVYISSGASVTFEYCKFINNVATRGGAISTKEPGQTTIKDMKVTIKNCEFINNKGTMTSNSAIGGAVYVFMTNLDLRDSKFINNNASNNGYGGALIFAGKTETENEYDCFISNCEFEDNNALKSSYGAVQITNSNNVTVENCNFTRNVANTFGGAVCLYVVENVIVNNCKFINNTAQGARGAGGLYVSNPANNVEITNCKFIGNKVTGTTGVDGGAGLYLRSVSTLKKLENCEFINNTADNGNGAGFYAYTAITDFDFKNCNFTGNTAKSGDGGAIHIQDSSSNINFVKNTFVNNSASGKGGAIYLGASFSNYVIDGLTFDGNVADEGSTVYFAKSMPSLTVQNSIFKNNKVENGDGGALLIPTGSTGFTLTATDFIGNEASGKGGAIYLTDSYSSFNLNGFKFEDNVAGEGGAIYFNGAMPGLTITKSNFTNNKATSSNAGAIYIAAGSNNADITNCKFIGNNATLGNGGSIYFKADSDNIAITDSVFDNNTAKSGGAVQFYAASSDIGFTNIDITRTNFTNNNATQSNDYGGSAIAFNKVTDVDFDKCVFDNNVATKYGALMFENYNDVYYNECNFTNNNAGEGGVAYYRGSSSRTTVNYMKCLFENNSATNGGAIYSTGKDLTMTKCTYINNTATGDAGVVYSTGDNLIIKDGDFKNNTADKGGIIYATGNTLNITNSNFTNNAARHYAGVVYATGDYINVLNSKFDDNEARPLVARERSNGGVMYILGNHVTIKKSNFTNNLAWSWGGAIIMGDEDGNKNLIQTDDLKIISCRFVDNQAYNAAAIDTYGTSNAHILHTVFINNQAGQTAGAVYMTGAAGLIDDCNFTNNKAINGSAIMYIPPPVGTVDPTMSNITNCNFIGNNATGNATLWFESSKGRIVSCNFTNNTVKDNSGAIYLNIDQVTIDGNRFINNTARDGHGGAIYVQESSKVHDNTISNSVFTNNTAKGNGGAIYDAGKTDNINYCNFTTNRAGKDGGAIYFNSDSGSIIGSRFINNTAVNGGAVVLAQSTQTIRNSTFIGNNASGKGGAIHALSKSTLRVQDSTFENNTANDGGAIYFEGYAHSDPIHNNGLILWNDTFIKNIAIYNGGAVYYIVNATYPYRDYNLFNHEGDNSTGRVTWEHAGKELIHTSLFKDNLDYYMNVTAKSEGNRAIVITVVVPGRYNRATVKVNITVYDSEGNVVANLNNVNYTGSTIQNADWNQTTNLTTIQIHLTEQKLGNYTAFVGIQDDMHRYKEQSINYTSELTDKGDFTKLQELIDDALAKAAITGERAVVNLNESRYTYSIDLDPLAGQGQINITGPITINGLGTKTTINALNYCRIFDINASDVIINNVIFMNGNASGNQSNSLDTAHGGAILWLGSNGLIESSTFSFNNAYDGGAVFVQSGTFDSINNCEFDHNTAVHNGGAVDWNATKGNLTNSRLFDNKAAYGGAVFVGANGASSNIYNVNFTNNNASQRGGAVDWYGNTGLIELSNFNNNNASYGGAVFVGHETDGGKILNSTFNNNYATIKGGAIDWNATGGEVKYSSFTGNHADYGGAVFVGTYSEEGTIYNSTFNNNYATYNGGAIDWNASKGNVNKSYFYNNYVTEGNGGAIFIGSNGNAGHIINSVFEGNNATNGRGGAVDWYASAGDIEYSNFTNNHADYGGAVFVGHATEGGNITNSRFIKNTATVKGGAVDWNATSGNLRNSYFKENSADYGGALFVGSYSTSGSEYNNTYIANHANKNGGAIDLNTTGGMINASKFYNNTADENGGAVFVGANGTTSHIVDSVFDGNNAINRGGAVDWYASSGEIYNTTFNNNRAYHGGAVYMGSHSEGGKIILSNFTNNNVSEGGIGGAVYWDSSNGDVEDSYFESNTATQGGAIYVKNSIVSGKIYNSTFIRNTVSLYGGAVHLKNARDVNVLNSTFMENEAFEGSALFIEDSDFLVNDTRFESNNADYGGAVYVSNSQGKVANSSFVNNRASYGSIHIYECENVNVTDTTFNQNIDQSSAIGLYIDESTDILLNNLTLSYNDNAHQAIMIGCDVTLNDIKFTRWYSSSDSPAIIFSGGNSSLSNSSINGNNAIKVASSATVYLNSVNNTNADTGDYSVENEGTLYLSKNNFTNVIINNGRIMTPTTTRVLDNGTLEILIGADAMLNATVVDDYNNTIICPSLSFIDNTTFENASTNDGKVHFATYASVGQGVYLISVNNTAAGLMANTIKTGLLKVKDPNTTLELNITQEKQGEIVTIKAILHFSGLAAGGNVTFNVNGVKQYANVTTSPVNSEFIATLVLNNLTPDTYFVTAVYNGDDTHMGCQNNTYFVVDKRDVNLSIVVNNVVYGVNATAVVTTNANGTVTLYLNGKRYAEIINGTATLNYTDLAPGNYTIDVEYAGNTYYNSASNTTNFTVYEYDMTVDISETQFNQSATITVTLPGDVDENVTIKLNDQELNVTYVGNGVFKAVTDKLAVNEYRVNVTYTGNDKYTYAKTWNGTFNVTADKDYTFNVNITPVNPKYGENVTINITGPAGQSVNVTIDGEVIPLTFDENGTAVITRNNFTAGSHTIVANVTGNENYTSKEITKTLTVDSAIPEMTITVTQPIAPNTPANVTVTVGKNATGTVYIKINGTTTPVEVKNGTAVLPIDTSKPGDYVVTAQFVSDDDNYKSAKNLTGVTYTVDKYNTTVNSTVEIGKDNHVTVTVKVNGTADGNVTLYLNNGTNITVDVENGVATFDLGIIIQRGDYNFTAVFNGDDTFNSNSTKRDFNVGKLNNGTMNITVVPNPAEFGDGVEVIIDAPGLSVANLTVTVNGVDYNATKTGDKYIAVIPDLPVDVYDVNVTCKGDDNYNDFNASTTYEVKANSSYVFKVDVTPAPFGGNTTINITGPAGVNVTVSIDGTEQNVILDENGTYVITVNDLGAGSHNVTATIPDSVNYTFKSVTEKFTIDRQVPSMEIIVPSQPIAAGSTANIVVKVGDNATGNVTVYIDNVRYEVRVVDGEAVLPINTTKAGTFSVTAQYLGDENYTSGANNTAQKYTVNKYDITMTYTNVTVAPNNTVTFEVTLNETDAEGEVVITVGDKNYTAAVENGVAKVVVGPLAQSATEYKFAAVYSGDEKYNSTKVDVNVTVGKLRNGTMDISIVPNPGEYGQSVNITVTVPGATDGNVTVNVNGTDYPAVPVAPGVYEVIVPELPVGDYPINVTYGNGTRYDEFKDNTTMSIGKNSTYEFGIVIEPKDNVKYGDNVTINVTGLPGSEVEIIVDGVVYDTVTIGGDGKASKVYNNLTAATHTIVANYSGNESYEGAVAQDTITIGADDPEMIIKIVPGENVAPASDANITVFIGKNATGTAIIYIDGVPNEVPVINGFATLPINTTVPGTHNVTAMYLGDDGNYVAGVNTTGILYTIEKYDVSMENLGAVVAPNNEVTFTVKLNVTDAKGDIVYIEYDGKNYTGVVDENGVAQVTVGPMAASDAEYNLNAVYNGSSKYAAANVTVNATVGKLGNGTMAIDITPKPVQYGDNATVTVSIPDVSDGNVTVWIDGENYTAVEQADGTYVAVLPALPFGNHPINVTYANGTKYKDFHNDTVTLSVETNSSYEFDVEVTQPVKYGENTTITVNAPAGIKQVNVTVDNETYTVNINATTGKATLVLNNLSAGNHKVTANFTGNNNYTAKTVTEPFTVAPQTPSMEIIVPQSPIAANTTANIVVKVGKNATGNVTIYIDNVRYEAPIVDGEAVLPINTTKAGTFTVTAQYIGDANYTGGVNNTAQTYTVNKFDISMTYENNATVAPDNTVTFEVKLNQTDAKGNVTINYNNVNYTADVIGGVAKVSVPLTQSTTEYKLTALYSGDDKYNTTSVNVNVTVGKLGNGTMTVDITPKPVQYGDNATVTVSIPDVSDGNVTVWIDGENYTAVKQADGTYVAVLPALPVGDHPINVTYANDTRYKNFHNDTVTLSVETNSSYEFDVDVAPGKYGENTTITVNAPAGVKQVNVTVDNETYTVSINATTGKATLVLNNLSAGNHKVTANFTGNNNYTAKTVTEPFTVAPQTPSMEIIVPQSPIAANTTANIVVKVGKNATGNVTIYIDNVRYEAPIVDGEAVLPINTTKAGTFTVTAQYIGDANYTGGVNNTAQTYTVNKFDISMSYTGATVADDNTVTFRLSLNETDASGIVKITVDGQEFSGIVNEGVAEVIVTGLTQNETEYRFIAVYSDDPKYNTTSVEVNVTVGKLNNGTMTVEVIPNPSEYGDSVNVTVTVQDVTGGNVTVWIGNENYTAVKQADGTYVAIIPALSVGDHPVNVTYTNGSKYNDFYNDDTVIITTRDGSYVFNVEVNQAKYGDNTTITVTAPAGVGKVNVTVDNVTYSVEINATTGKGILVLNNISAGLHNVTASFKGNTNYTGQELNTTFTVPRQDPEMQIIVPAGDITVNTKENVTLIIGNNATGDAIIYIDNVPYPVTVENGIATVPIDTTKPGVHNVTAKYFGDENYTGGSNNTVIHYTVGKYNTTMNVEYKINDNNTVTFTVKLNSTAGGNITVEVAGKPYNATVTNGIATFTTDPLDNGTYNVNVKYNGDDRFNVNSSDVGFEIKGLRNFTVKIDVMPGKHNETTRIIVTGLPENADGNVTVNINGKDYPATLYANGTAVLDVVLPAGDYDVNVTYNNSDKYEAKENSTSFKVDKQDTYPLDIKVTPAPFGENSTITITAPADVKEVNVTVDGETHTVPIDENGKGILKLDNLTAGKHDVTVTYNGDANYTESTNSTSFNVPKQTPEMKVDISPNREPNTNVTVTVKVGDNATGLVNVVVDGKDNIVPVRADGTVEFNTTALAPGNHTIEVKLLSDDNYNATSVGPYTITMDKYNTTMDCTKETTADNNVTIVVKLNATATGTVYVEYNNINYSGKVENGVARVNLGIISEQKDYVLPVYYSGDENFNKNSTEVKFKVDKLENATVKVEVTPGEYGDNTTIKVTVPSDGDGNVTIYIGGVPTVVTPVDGVAVLNVTPGVGPHDVRVEYTNDTRYAPKQNTTEFTVPKDSDYDFTVDIVPKDANYTDEVTVIVKAPAGLNEVNVTIDGVTVTVPIDENGTGTYKISNLTSGDHTVIAGFEGNENYTKSSTSASFTIGKTAPTITVDVVQDPVEAGSDVQITVNIDKNATGQVNIIVDGADHLVDITDGVATYTAKGVTPNGHNITVKYNGDVNYTAGEKNASFTVKDYPTTVTLEGIETDENNNVTVIVKVNGTATGNVTITIGDKTYTANVTDGVARVNVDVLPKGDQEINITYNGDDDYAPQTITETITVPALKNYTLGVESKDIKYGETAQVNVTLPEGASPKNLTFILDGNVITEGITQVPGTNIVQVNIPDLKAGDHTVTVRYAEDNTYADNENSTTFNVATVQPGIKNITVHEPIDVGETLNITVELPEDATGTITVDVNGTKYVVDVVNGTANITIPKLDNGTYNVTVTYSGDDNYDGFTQYYNASVEKVNPEITANTTEIKLGEDAVINVTLPSDATGTVTVKVGDIEKTFAVTGGENSLSIPGIPVGENQEVIVTYNGDNKYAADNTTVLITVKPKDTTADDFNVEDKGNGTIIVTAPEGATGQVNLTIGNETYTVNITDGKAVFNIANETNQTPGSHEITLTYAGDENNTAVEFNSTANVPKWSSTVNVDIPTIREGDTAKVNVTVTSTDNRGYTPNGTVRVIVDGKGYTGELKDGSVIIDVPGLGEGPHEVKVYYDGDDYFLSNETDAHVNVQEAITAKVEGTGNNSQVVVQLPENHTEDVKVLIDGDEYPHTIDENGTVKTNLTGVVPGEHTLKVIYTDENGTVSVVEKTIIVPPWDSSVSASAKTIREGDVATIVVTTGAAEMNGTVTVKINGTSYSADITNGTSYIYAAGLKNNTYAATVTYSGNWKYLPSNNTFTVTVEAPIKLDVNGTGNSSQVIVDLPGNGTVQVFIDGNETDVIVENGTAKANLTGLVPGPHNVTVRYTDEDGTVSEVTQEIIVPPWDSSVTASAKTIRQGDVANITVKVGSANMTGRVTVDINGTGYYAEISNGEAVIRAAGLGEGTHYANVTYEGNYMYLPSNNTFKVVVEAPIVISINGTGNSSQVVVDLPANHTGATVEVYIDGNKTNVTVDNNTAVANLTGLEPGTHNITVVYTDEDGVQSIVNQTITVPKWDSSVSASAPTIREGDDETITVTLGAEDMTGTVTVDIDGTGYYANVIDGKATILAPGIKTGTHDAVVKYLGNDKYLPSNNTFSFVVEAPIEIDMTGAGNSSQVVVKLPENGTENVTVLVDGKEVPVSFVNGTAVANLTNTTPGEHNVTVIYTDKDGRQSIANATITVYVSIKANDMTRGWASPYDYEAEFLDKDGHVIANTTMQFTVNGKTYNVKTDNKGIAKLTESKLPVGAYEVEITNLKTGEVVKHNLTIVKRLIENKDVTMDFVDGSQYVVRAIGDDGKPVGAGEIVKFSANGINYASVTDSKGYAKLTINLNPKTYTITAHYAAYTVSNNLKVKQTLKLVKKTVKVKKTAKKLVIKAKLKWSNGKAIKGKKLTLKFKGKTYKAKTNKKGIAKFTIKKKVIKKLKKGKKYNYSVAYKTNKVKGKVKVKK